MKANFLKATILALVTIFTISCSKDESSNTTDESSSSTTQSQTWVKLTAITTAGVPKANYKIMMFKTQPTTTTALPTIEKEVTTDANGLAYFDLNTMITSTIPATYYFEAFVQTGADYTWKSVTHYNVNLSKGTMATSSIIVN
jgi:hypothetical protein